jgi:hypothetical protein
MDPYVLLGQRLTPLSDCRAVQREPLHCQSSQTLHCAIPSKRYAWAVTPLHAWRPHVFNRRTASAYRDGDPPPPAAARQSPDPAPVD